MPEPELTSDMELFLAAPRGFCGGVRRAISIVEQALSAYGAPVYVRHEIVHNKHVVENLRQKGAVFIEDFSEIGDRSRPVILSAHGAAKCVYDEAQSLGLNLIDATCPLVAKVHQKIAKLATENKNIIVIGKSQHPEIIGTVGQITPYPSLKIIATTEEAEVLYFDADAPVGMVTQTTLSVDDVAKIMAILQKKFGTVDGLSKSDTCYATTHRQAAVRAIAKEAEAIVVVGSKNSSNSRQLQKIALTSGVKKSFLIDDVSEMPWKELDNVRKLGISAGASAPEELVQEIIDAFKNHYRNLKIHDIIVAKETVSFKP